MVYSARTGSADMDEFLRTYGLIAIYFGMWLEGETVLVIAGFLAHQHVLPIWAAFAVTVLGALTVDHLIYGVGRLSSRVEWIRRHLHPDAGEADSWQRRLGDSWMLFFGVRFVYGTRSPFLFYLGSRRMGWPKFLRREIPAVAVWCSVWLFFGHLLSNLVALALGRIQRHHQMAAVGVMALAGLVVFALLAFLHRRRRRRAEREEPADAGDGS
jgi:membrane protein DedA with SNARE-associated domain